LLLNHLIGVVVIAALLTPLAAGFFVGPTKLETNSGVGFPHPALNFGYLGRISSWLAESVSLKNQAIRVDGRIDRVVFRETASAGSTSPRVIYGAASILFISDALNEACNPHIQTPKLIARMTNLAQVVTDSGREFRLIVSPDKSSILRDYLPIKYPLKACFETYNDDFWKQLQKGDVSGFVNLQGDLSKARSSRREILFKRRDTHWDDSGAAIASRAVVNSFVPGLWEDNLLNFTGLGEYNGDLNVLSGETLLDSAPTYSHVRADVEQVSVQLIDGSERGQNRSVKHTSTSSYLIPGRTLVLGDSFSEAAEPFFANYFEDITFMRLSDFSTNKYLNLIADADRVMFWSVERSFPYRVAYDWGTEDFIRALRKSLK